MRAIAPRAALLLLTLAALSLPGSAAGNGTSGRPITFSGSCQFSGPIVFEPPLTNTPQVVDQSIEAPGTCTGTLVDRHGRAHQLDGASVTYMESAQAAGASCAAGAPTGSGALQFRWGKLRFAFSETRVAAVVALSLSGAQGGSATGSATPSSSENPVTTLQACAGSGVEQTEIDVRITTTPEISG
jgi:hypothetical protein